MGRRLFSAFDSQENKEWYCVIQSATTRDAVIRLRDGKSQRCLLLQNEKSRQRKTLIVLELHFYHPIFLNQYFIPNFLFQMC